MHNSWKAVRILLLSAGAVTLANADTIVFTNGDKLAGALRAIDQFFSDI